MSNAELKIVLRLKDEATKQIETFRGHMIHTANEIKKNWLPLTAVMVAVGYGVKKLADAHIAAAKELVNVSSKVEQLKVRLEGLLGSAEKGNQVFADMSNLASQVPKTFDEIMESATNLAAVVRTGETELKQLMPIIVDISSATGMSVQDVTSQVIRMYSAGAAAADTFRQRGVSAALGFQAGVKYTARETMDTIIKQWEDGTGKFVGAAKRLANTFEGQVSMMQDAWFQFKADIGKAIFEKVKEDLSVVLSFIQKSKEEGGEYANIVKEINLYFGYAYDSAKDFFALTIVGGGQALDIINDIRLNIQRVHSTLEFARIGFYKFVQFLQATPRYIFSPFGDKTEAENLISEIIDDLTSKSATGIEQVMDLERQANADYSSILEEKINALKTALERQRQEILQNEQAITSTIKQEEQARLQATAARTQAELKLWIENNKTYVEASVSMGKTTATIMGELATMTGETWLKGAEIVINTIVSVMEVIIAAINSTLGPIGWLKASLEITAITLASVNAYAQLEAQKKALSQLKSTTAMPTVNVPTLAGGGDVSSKGYVVVGERGPELLNLPRGARVTPLTTNNNIGETHVYININLAGSYIGAEEIADQIAPAIKERLDMINFHERRRR